jgi:CheY-like chemotaxis protein
LVLIADDNRDLARALSVFLTLGGFEVKCVHDGAEALAAAIAHMPDALLLDIGLPSMDGFEVAAQIRQRQELNEMRIIAISAYQPEFLGERRGQYFDHHLIKPFDLQSVAALVRPPDEA